MSEVLGWVVDGVLGVLAVVGVVGLVVFLAAGFLSRAEFEFDDWRDT